MKMIKREIVLTIAFSFMIMVPSGDAIGAEFEESLIDGDYYDEPLELACICDCGEKAVTVQPGPGKDCDDVNGDRCLLDGERLELSNCEMGYAL